MPVTLGTILTDLMTDAPALVIFVQQAEAAVAALPPKATAKPSDYCKLASAILAAAGPLADQLETQVKPS